MEGLYDAHCHLGFASDAVEVAREARGWGIHALCSTTTPEDFERTSALLAGSPGILVGIGLHPWWVDEGRCGADDATRFEDLVSEAAFVGEVGLDLSGHRKRTRAAQVAAFERAMACVKDRCPGKPVFLHAVRSTEAVLEVLEGLGVLASNPCVFHWFSGSADQLRRAARQGAWFSCSARMIAQERGARIAAMVPDDRLLAETDGPQRKGMDWSAAAWAQGIEDSISAIARARACDDAQARTTIARNYLRLASLMDA